MSSTLQLNYNSMDLVNKLNKKYVYACNSITPHYEKVFGLPCDIYFPINNSYKGTTKYRDVKIFGPHQSPTYAKEPDIVKAVYYIPHLIPKQAMNSSETEYSPFYLEDEQERPFIETSKKRELPISSKVVVHQGGSQIKFFIDKKLVVTGADGFMLLRMYLAPLAKDEDEDEIETEQEEFELPVADDEWRMEIPDED